MSAAIELKIEEPAPQKLNSYYTVDLVKEKRKHDFKKAGYLFLGVAVVVVAIATIFFLFSFSVDAVIYIPYLAIATILFIKKANIENKYYFHRGNSLFIKRILKTIPNVNPNDLPKHPNIDLAQQTQLKARCQVAKEALNDRMATFVQTLEELKTATDETRPLIVQHFFSTKKAVLDGLNEVSWIKHLLKKPYESIPPQDYASQSAHRRNTYQAIATTSITVV